MKSEVSALLRRVEGASRVRDGAAAAAVRGRIDGRPVQVAGCGACGRVVWLGIAGALSPDLEVGDLVVVGLAPTLWIAFEYRVPVIGSLSHPEAVDVPGVPVGAALDVAEWSTSTRSDSNGMIEKETCVSTKERLGEDIATLAARIDAATYELLVLIRQFDKEEGWNCGFLNCAQWLTWRVGLGPSAARERVRVARALGDLPLISEAMKRGQLSYSKVRAITRIARPDTEKDLVELGKAATAAHIERVVRSWRRIDRSVEAVDEELREASSQVTMHVDENGMFVIRGRLAPEAGEVVMKALKAASEKLYAESQEDQPPAGELRADALTLVAESALKGGLDPGSSGDRYQVVVHVSDEELKTPADDPATGCMSCVSGGTPPAHVHLVDNHRAGDARERFTDYVLPTIRQPSEVWLQEMTDGAYRRVFLGRFADGRNIVVVDHWDGAQEWILWTFFPTASAPNSRRHGQLLHARR